ncbi:hypothetical protein LOY70_04340 [Pseudomonas sp. B21-054]|uniref:hypothetical protein n=1 Tax=Pseudomonas sp. B21-054 TaxID=2895494 RepID=UPI00222F7DAC|nr:hypothetical protein [Pseudomonas sp. B21-054]UZE18831.1 hypothetical protein LOY70_04340 [Pseudomonas sp. B21-054]
MEMDDEFLEVNDLDWFASFEGGHLAHFATGGRGFVPQAVRSSIADYEAIYDFFSSLDEKFDFEVIEENLPLFNNDAQRNRYLQSFIHMAKKGLYSYDAGDGFYRLVVRPKEARSCSELPPIIRSVLCSLPIVSFGCVNNIKNSDLGV